jgi:acyl dehydratase
VIDRSFIGRQSDPRVVKVDPARVAFFARVVGETNPVYCDEAAAKAHGHPSLMVPPTFLVCLGTDPADQFKLLDALGVDIRQILHGEQEFQYFEPCFAGETLSFQGRVAGVESKKGGELELLYLETDVRGSAGQLAARMRATLVVRHRMPSGEAR